MFTETVSRDTSPIIGPDETWCDKFIVLRTLNRQAKIYIYIYTPYISGTQKVHKSCRYKMATLALDVYDVHGASL